MNQVQSQALKHLLRRHEVAALGTLHGGEPFVSMVPYALLPADGSVVIHVSRLASHTRDMESHAGVSVLVMEDRSPDVPPQALARVSLQGPARPCPSDDARHEAAREAYLSRFPNSQEMFGFADFSLFVIEPKAVRFVAGFAQAWSVSGADYARLMSEAA